MKQEIKSSCAFMECTFESRIDEVNIWGSRYALESNHQRANAVKKQKGKKGHRESKDKTAVLRGRLERALVEMF